MSDEQIPRVCAGCGEPLMPDGYDPNDDISLLKDRNGKAIALHKECFALENIQVVSIQMPTQDVAIGGLAVLFENERVARRYFKRIHKWIEAGEDLRVDIQNTDSSEGTVTISAGLHDRLHDPFQRVSLEFTGATQALAAGLSESLANHGYYLVFGGEFSGNSMTPYQDAQYQIQCRRLCVDGQETEFART